MLEVFAAAVSALSLAASAVLGARVRALEGRLAAAERGTRDALPASPLSARPSPLDGLRVSLALTQDHPYPVFATLLKERLLGEGAEIASGSEADLFIDGDVVCNGYADVYFTANLAVRAPGAPLFTLVEKPAHGDRQGNLALELVTRLKTEWEKRSNRDERRSALRELREG